jgi:hypothetical protein
MVPIDGGPPSLKTGDQKFPPTVESETSPKSDLPRNIPTRWISLRDQQTAGGLIGVDQDLTLERNFFRAGRPCGLPAVGSHFRAYSQVSDTGCNSRVEQTPKIGSGSRVGSFSCLRPRWPSGPMVGKGLGPADHLGCA